jgi:uncharacterized protein YndB with AHSA1/START domain
MRTLQKEIVVSESRELLWYAWTISERVSEWFAAEANIDPRVGGADSLTEVHVRFMQAGDKTTNVSIEHTGWGTGEEWDKAFQWHEMAWTQVLNSLKSALESGQGELCCTPGQSAS